MNYWVVKAKPSENDLSDVARDAVHGWFTRRRPTLAVGDRVFLWWASPKLRVEALAEVVREARKAGNVWTFKLRCASPRLEHPIPASVCKRLPYVRNAAFLKSGPMGTLFALSRDQARSLFGEVCRRNDGLGDIWRDWGALPPYLADEELQEAAEDLEMLSKTDREQVVMARNGQGRFRAALEAEWGGVRSRAVALSRPCARRTSSRGVDLRTRSGWPRAMA